ncbi:hypothetical protein MMC14_006575 [Varicellaria rhodocarpa]|nr:hypothetical protein [Varicellaria rhodocarpa]
MNVFKVAKLLGMLKSLPSYEPVLRTTSSKISPHSQFTTTMIRSPNTRLARLAYRYAVGTGYDVRLVAMAVLLTTWVSCSISIYFLSWLRYAAAGVLVAVPALSFVAARMGNSDHSLKDTIETIIHHIETPDLRTSHSLPFEASHEQAIKMLEANVVLD